MIAKMTLALGLAILATGCSMVFQARPSASGLVDLEQQKSVFVVIPDDANIAGVSYVGSGQAVAQVIAGAFSKRGVAVHIAGGRLSAVDAVAAAARLKAGYTVLPVITRWDHRSERFGHSDGATIRITVVDVISGDTVASRIIEGRTRTVSITSHAPGSLLEGPVRRFVNGLYRFGDTPAPQAPLPDLPPTAPSSSTEPVENPEVELPEAYEILSRKADLNTPKDPSLQALPGFLS